MALPPPSPIPPHNHPPHEWVIQRNELYQRLKERAKGEPTAFHQIYMEEAVRFQEGAVHLPYEHVLPCMRKLRRKTQPAIPRSLEEYAGAITHTPQGYLLIGTASSNGAHAVILGMPGFGQCLRLAKIVLADGTFYSVPAGLPMRQLLTLHTIYKGRYFHPIIILMANRTRGLYQEVLALLWRLAERPTPTTILTDYEAALQAALEAVCPTARVQGCYFHYTQALVRRARSIGMATAPDTPGGRILRLYIALALLPAEMVAPALAAMRDTAATFNAQFVPELDEYFRAYWMQQIGPERFAVGAELHRTTNVAESFHRQLNSTVVRHPNIWQLTMVLEQHLVVSRTRFEARLRNNLPGARNFARYAVRHNECLRLHGELRAGSITLQECLLQLADPGFNPVAEDLAVAIEDIGAEVEVGAPAAAMPQEIAEAEFLEVEEAPVDADGDLPIVAAPAAAVDRPDFSVVETPAPRLCQICKNNTIDSAFVPCGHCICSPCAVHLERNRVPDNHICPFCRAHVQSLLRLYL